MPDERTRALRFDWELLLEIPNADCLIDAQRKIANEILRHYPTEPEIKVWAADCAQPENNNSFIFPELAPEKQKPQVISNGSQSRDEFERGSTTPQQRTRALCL